MRTTASQDYPPELAVGVTSSRIAHVSPAARTVHKAILRGFAASGQAPDMATLTDTAPTHELGALLGELHDQDVVRLDENGQIRAAYPFSATPTAHAVAIDGGPTVWSMCAVDALGIADMLNRRVAITSTDPATGEQIEVDVLNGRARWRPETGVVLVGSDAAAASTDADCCRPDDGACAVAAADRCCGVMNFFASRATAKAWLAEHPEVSGVVLTQPQALRLGVDIFGRLLDD